MFHRDFKVSRTTILEVNKRMLINKSIWVCLLFLLIVSGCSNKFEKLYKEEQEAHRGTQSELASQQKGLESIHEEYSDGGASPSQQSPSISEILNFIETQLAQLKSEQNTLKSIREGLESIHEEYSDGGASPSQQSPSINKILEFIRGQLESKHKAEKDLESIRGEIKPMPGQPQPHPKAQKELKSIREGLESIHEEYSDGGASPSQQTPSINKILEFIRGQLKQYKSLRETKELPIETYFTLGQLLVKEANKKKERGNYDGADGAKELYKVAIDYLQKVLGDSELSADAHYYIARAYYEMLENKKAYLAAQRAIQAAGGKHPRAKEILDMTSKYRN